MDIPIDDLEYAPPKDVTRRYGLSRARQYRLNQAGEIEMISLGGRSTLVRVESVRRYLAGRPPVGRRTGRQNAEGGGAVPALQER